MLCRIVGARVVELLVILAHGVGHFPVFDRTKNLKSVTHARMVLLVTHGNGNSNSNLTVTGVHPTPCGDITICNVYSLRIVRSDLRWNWIQTC